MRRPDAIQADLDEVEDILSDLEPSDDPFSSTSMSRRQYENEREALLGELEDATTPIVDLVLTGSGVYGNTVRADILSRVLGRLQDSVNAVAQSLTGEVTKAGKIGGDLLAASQLRLAGTFAGSFGAHLRGPLGSIEPSLFDDDVEESLLERSVGEIQRLIRVAREAGPEADDEIVDAVLPLGPRAVGHLKELAAALAANNTVAEVKLRRPMREDTSVVIAQAVARRLQTVLTRTTVEEETVELTGLLGGASEFRNRFELRVGTDIYGGTVVDELVPSLRAAYGHVCRAQVLIRRSVTEASNRPRESYTLVGLEVL